MSTEYTNEPTPETTPPRKKRRWFWRLMLSLFILALIPLVVLAAYVIHIYPTLPDASTLKNVSYQVPLRIETADGKVITEIGEKRRIPLAYHEIPPTMTQAIISAEDEHFYQHPGVDFWSLARAAYELITTGEKQSGGSTITMQVARNFFLSNERSYERKLNEIILSFKIEQELSKQEIMALYLNKIFLGHRSYGVAAAANTYYGRPLSQLKLHEYAMIAGLPKAPSAFNPVVNPNRAKQRRNYVLRRMFELGFIDADTLAQAQNEPVEVQLTGVKIEVEAGYVAEMARQFALEQFGEDALNLGLTLVTTIQSEHQQAANVALRDGLQQYERRHGYRGPVATLVPTVMTNPQQIIQALRDYPAPGHLILGAVTDINANEAKVLTRDNQTLSLPFEGVRWAAPYLTINALGPAPKSLNDVLKVGDVIYLSAHNDSWQLAQNPQAEAALVSISPRDGQIYALVGGFDYFKSRFNRVTQARRQLGSAFKPFLYSSALERGFTPASLINDAPVVFHDSTLEDVWRPENYSGRFYGPTLIRDAIAYSRNLVPIRLLRDIGILTTIQHAALFGLPLDELNKHRNLSLALGSAQFTPLEAATAYAVFANGGYRVEPYIVKEVRDFNGQVVYRPNPRHACQTELCSETDPSLAEKAISPQNAYLMTSMLQDVINKGTGRAAGALERADIAGKTGTTNQQFDAWFVGYNPDVATSVWVGFDNPATLGQRETAGRAALPIWIDYMRYALQASPNVPFMQPAGLLHVPIDPNTGLAVPADTPGARFELFYERFAPQVPEITDNRLRDLTRELFD